MPSWPVFLGGTAKPIGCSLSFIERPAEQVVDELLAWRSGLAERHGNGVTVGVAPSRPTLDALDALDPMVAPWEQPDRYEAHRVRDRLDRELLVDYLAEFEIHPDDTSFFGNARVVRQSVPWRTRTRCRSSAGRTGGSRPARPAW